MKYRQYLINNIKYSEYIIITNKDSLELLQAIVEHLLDSWEPIGGMMADIDQGFPPLYHQTMGKK